MRRLPRPLRAAALGLASAARVPRLPPVAFRVASRATIVATAVMALSSVHCNHLLGLDDYLNCPQDPGCPSCSDGKKNGGETDVDCGGECGPCAGGQSCKADEDCASGVCTAGQCEAPAGPGCSDGVKNGDETGKDCGGGMCAPCPVGEGCIVGTDCESLACGAAHVCVAARCDDMVRNGDETDTDCGGSCPACGLGGHCAVDADCTPHVCSGGSCAMACSPGDKRCSGNDAQTCDSDGVWQTSETCTYVCDAGSCTGVCSPDTKQCLGLDAQTCDASGQWQTTETCQYLCDAGSCAGMCTPGAKQCSALVPQTCDATGQWQSGTACPYLCSGGDCTGCAPGSKQCAGSTVQTCDANYQWQNGTPCSGTTPFCSAGICSTSPPSCQSGATGAGVNCGPSSSESCCTSLLVTGGTFYRSYDGVAYTDMSYPATVSSFKLDKFEVTVGRFRQFVNAWLGGWRPAAGAGKHPHLHGGNGLADSANPGAYETGWDPAWNLNSPTTAAGWAMHLGTATYATWSPVAGNNEKRPINVVSWYDAYAFCIWDGAFLPSEAEWNYAASGGSQQRVYPWGSTAPGPNANLAVYGCYYNGTGMCTGVTNIAPVGSVAAGNGRYGQADLAGNVVEWTLDSYASYVAPCDDCAYLDVKKFRALRSGAFGYAVVDRASQRETRAPDYLDDYDGFRCARSP